MNTKICRALRNLAAIASLCTATLATAQDFNPLNEPLPMVGTGAHGHTYPGATVPFGMVQLSPDTRTDTWDGCSGYHYSDAVILGFTHTHLSGTGCPGLGDILLMPEAGEIKWDAGSPGNGYASKFSHDQEKALPGYYRVFLDTPKVTAELTASERCGFHKYTFPASDHSRLLLDLGHGVGNSPIEGRLRVEDGQTVSGYRLSDGWGGARAVYFVLQFSKPFASVAIKQDDQMAPENRREATAKVVKAAFDFKTDGNEAVLVKVGISGASIEGARKNLAREIPGWDFDAVRSAAAGKWEKVFDEVAFQSFDPALQRTFYANLYLSCLAPTLFNDVDGTYRGCDHQNHTNAAFQNYTTFSIWDIYRAEWPLITLIHPGRVDDMVQTMLAEYTELGQHTTPIWPLWGNETWCMIGYHSVDMISEAYLEGYRGFDANAAFRDLRDTAMQNRNGLDTYKKLGYVASRRGACATSCTLEYTVDDWCLAKMAEALGQADDAQLFYKRAANYRNLFDQSTQVFRGRRADGRWRTPFTFIGLVGDEYTEADAWQYAFAVQQDVPGLIATYGGDAAFVSRMDTLFTTNSAIDTGIPDISGLIGQDSQGDEQCHHVPYLYDYAGAPYKTQERVRQVMAKWYNDTPAGQCGNDDCGQMSAWYVFSALGFYPVNPASGVYAIGSPVAAKAVLHLDADKFHGKTFTVEAQNNRAENVYIQSATLNGQPLNRAWITRDEVTAGGELAFVMGSQPNPDWAAAANERPPATMPAGFQYPPLPEPAPTNGYTVPHPLPIRIACGSDEPIGKFQPDDDMNSGAINHADARVNTSAPGAAPARVYQNERYSKDFTYTFPVPPGSYRVRLHFAEMFDDGAGNRIENIYLNGREVLQNFDIFAAAKGMYRAVVKEYPAVAPDPEGNIAIRITAAPDSPDQNAKISGLEILKESDAAAAEEVRPFTVTAADGKTKIKMDASAAPELADWTKEKLAPVLAEWYPKIAAMLPSPGFTAPEKFRVAIKPMDGVAYTAGTDVEVSADWCSKQIDGEAVGSVVHELVHVVQQYGQHYGDAQAPGWLIEGIADYVRWFKYEPESHGADMVWMRRHHKRAAPKYDEGYRATANFLDWVAEHHDQEIVRKLNAALREGTYTEDLWKEITGKTLSELSGEWHENIKTQIASGGK